MTNFSLIIQIVVSIVLIVVVSIQAKSSSLGTAFGGESSYHSKQKVEKVVFWMTVALGVLFVIFSLINIIA